MLTRPCSGGIVFFRNKVLIMENEKHEWILPQTRIPRNHDPEQTIQEFIENRLGLNTSILGQAGTSNYEFYSITRMRPVRNEITWYAMTSTTNQLLPKLDASLLSAGFASMEQALKQITYSQDKSVLMLAYQRYREQQADG
ncbi:MAG: NUDIX hydrolase [Oscillospiraceae bacterium]|nr:NUDIX hydrolase [Oscillospiraceae bacterium]MDD4367696.1 NUDIX hydrolase [Oscillospiraceae bacterium]